MSADAPPKQQYRSVSVDEVKFLKSSDIKQLQEKNVKRIEITPGKLPKPDTDVTAVHEYSK